MSKANLSVSQPLKLMDIYEILSSTGTWPPSAPGLEIWGWFYCILLHAFLREVVPTSFFHVSEGCLLGQRMVYLLENDSAARREESKSLPCQFRVIPPSLCCWRRTATVRSPRGEEERRGRSRLDPIHDLGFISSLKRITWDICSVLFRFVYRLLFVDAYSQRKEVEITRATLCLRASCILFLGSSINL